MLRCRLLHLVLRLGYHFSVLVALQPAPFDWSKREYVPSCSYLLYSALVHLCFVALIGGLVFCIRDQLYMSNDPVLQWSYTITNVLKVVTALLLIKDVWCCRHCWLAHYAAHCDLVSRFDCGSSVTQLCEREQSRLERYLIYKFVATIANLALNYCSFMITQGDMQLVPLAINVVLSLLLATAMYQLYCVFQQLQRHFMLIQLLLRQLQQRLLLHDCARGVGEAAQLAAIASMHYDCYRLAQRIFRSCYTASAALTLRLFTTNVRIVHHVIWFILQQHTPVTWSLWSTSLLMVFFYWDAVLLMAAAQDMLDACNSTGQLLQNSFADLPILSEHPNWTQTLEQFTLQLKCHRLVYKVWGLFEFNKEASLRYFIATIVHVIILVQFDLQLRSK